MTTLSICSIGIFCCPLRWSIAGVAATAQIGPWRDDVGVALAAGGKEAWGRMMRFVSLVGEALLSKQIGASEHRGQSFSFSATGDLAILSRARVPDGWRFPDRDVPLVNVDESGHPIGMITHTGLRPARRGLLPAAPRRPAWTRSLGHAGRRFRRGGIAPRARYYPPRARRGSPCPRPQQPLETSSERCSGVSSSVGHFVESPAGIDQRRRILNPFNLREIEQSLAVE